MTPIRFLSAVVIVAGVTAASPAAAAPIFAVELDFGGVQLTASTPLSETVELHSDFEGTNFYSRHAFGFAGPGLLQVSSEASIQLTPAVTLGLGSVLNGTDASAAFRLDDVVVLGPGSSVLGALNLDLDGSLHASAFAQLGDGTGAEASATASVSVGVSLAGSTFLGTQALSRLWQVETGSGGGSTFEDGLLTGFNGESVVTPFVLLPVGSPFTLVVNLRTSADTDSRRTIPGSRRQADAASLFAHSLSFPAIGPVFTLPAGYTVQSVGGLIVDNRWAGAAIPGTVPEPPLLLLMGGGFAWLALRVVRSRA